MKEASGEANMTVLVIVLIAIVAAIATPLIRGLMENTKYESCCTSAGGTWNGQRNTSSCQAAAGVTGTAATNIKNKFTACLNQS